MRGLQNLKTTQPLIVTARIHEPDLQTFDDLRKKHFPAPRNFLRAHITMFHRLPGEYSERVEECLRDVAAGHAGSITATVDGLRHLGAGVAFTLSSPCLQAIHSNLKSLFRPWLGGQDMQKWQPHITIQNKVEKSAADTLYKDLTASFQPCSIEVTGLDLWRYMDGPWKHCMTAPFAQP